MQRDMSVLQKLLESKERRMQDLVKSTGQHPLSQGQAGGGVGGGGGMKQHYERVLQDLEKERDVLQSEKAAIMQKMQALHSSSEEEKKRLEAFYKEKISQYDEKLKEVRLDPFLERENVVTVHLPPVMSYRDSSSSIR